MTSVTDQSFCFAELAKPKQKKEMIMEPFFKLL